MASNKSVVPEAKEALNRFKMEAASEVGVNLKQGYNGDLTSADYIRILHSCLGKNNPRKHLCIIII